MATDKVLLRDCTVHINTGTDAVPVWTKVENIINGVEHSSEVERSDVTDAESAGRKENRVTARGDVYTFAYFRKEDAATGGRDAGQDALETASRAIGASSLKGYKITTPGAKTLIFKATAKVDEFKDNNSHIGAEAELVVSGTTTRS